MKSKATSFYDSTSEILNLGLRQYMLSVFAYMAGGLALTAFVAYLVQLFPELIRLFFGNGFGMIFTFVLPLGIVMFLSFKISKISAAAARMLFFAYAISMGISLSIILVIYTMSSIATAFFITSAMFLSMVIYGYTTDKDLTTMGAYLFMGCVGLIIASIVNIFAGSNILEFCISIFGVVIFTGLTAYDAQVIKSYYYEADSIENSKKKAIFGALRLYMDFINLFVYILRLLGSKRD